MFEPTLMLWHLTYNSKEISDNNKLKFFFFQLGISIDHAQDLSKNLVNIDHTHSTFNFLDKDIFLNNKKMNSLFIEPLKYFYEINKLKINFPKEDPYLVLDIH